VIAPSNDSTPSATATGTMPDLPSFTQPQPVVLLADGRDTEDEEEEEEEAGGMEEDDRLITNNDDEHATTSRRNHARNRRSIEVEH
jgi:hypothetical protein